MALSVNKPKRIPLLFFLGIGIPCLLLGYLAFRGIQNDQALLEKERVNEHRKIQELVTKSVEDNILKAERSFLYVVTKHQGSDQPGLIHLLDSLKNLNPLVEEVFIFENSGEIQFPAAKLLFLPNGSIQASFASARTAATVKKIKSGQELEFQQKNYHKALAIYRQEFEQASDPQTKGELLISIARVQKKSALFRDAEKSYQTISRDYRRVQTTGGQQLGLAALSELSSSYMAANDTLDAVKTLLQFYKDLLNREWILDKTQYDFYSQNIKESVDRVFSKSKLPAQLQQDQSTFGVLKAEENKQKKITERLLAFQENAAEELKAKVIRIQEEPSNSARRFSLENRDQIYLVSLLIQYAGDESRTNEIWGFLLNNEFLRDNLLKKALQSNIISGKSGWIVKGRDDNIILKSGNSAAGSVTVRTNFEGGFPPWSVEFYQQEPDLFDAFLLSQRGVYFYVFLLLAGILIFGLILTNRTIAHELELSRMKSDFVSTISHEFKSPLSSIRQLSEMLQSGRIPSEEYRQQYYDVLVEQSERLTLLIDNILDFSKIEEGRKKFYFDMVDISHLLEETVSIINDQVRHKNFDIQLNLEKSLPLIMADRTAIAQAITNLIDNAVKYSGESRIVLVRGFTDNQYLIITVKDFGIGIRKEEIEKVFERFFRGGDALTRTVKGSGLGLTLVKRIVEVHHGKVTVESEPGHGSTFSVRLPLEGN